MAEVSDKPLVWLHSEIERSRPFPERRDLMLAFCSGDFSEDSMPHSRPMPSIGVHCHELRIIDRDNAWRIVYRIDADAIVIADVVSKKSWRTKEQTIERCNLRLRAYDRASK